MTILFMDGFDQYGADADGRLKMLEGVWAELTSSNTEPVVPAFGARTGEHALEITAASGSSGNFSRVVVPGGAVDGIRVAFGCYVAQLPQASDTHKLVELRTAGNTAIGDIRLQADGSVVAVDINDANVGSSSGPVITAGAWVHVEVLAVISTGQYEVRVNEVAQITLASQDLGAGNIGQIRHRINSAGGDQTKLYIDDLIISVPTGTYNTSWNGDLRVATIFPNNDTVTTGWDAYARQKFGTGILWMDADEEAIAVADDALLTLGSGDFTIEQLVRFTSLPTGSNKMVIAGQWNEAGDQRSWQLFKGGPSLGGGALVFRISTDGESGTVAEIHAWDDWFPEVGRYYHIAVSRVSSVTYLFIDGQLSGVGVADSNTYHNSTAELYIGGQDDNASGVTANTTFLGGMDEVRLTVGVGRYSANFTPAVAAFPRSGTDPSWANVEFIAGFDSGLLDESSNLLTVRNMDAEALQPADGSDKYKTISETAPVDDNYIAADYLFAAGTLTLTANAGNTETVVLGSQTYTFQTVLGGADTVLIGSDANDSLSNLAAAINNGSGEGTLYGTGTTQNADASGAALGGNQLLATATTQGTAGNSVTSTETLANGSWGAVTLEDGANIPGPITFDLGALPPTTTAVKAIGFFVRASKTDANSCNLQSSFVVSAAADNGADTPLTLAPAYYTDIFEEDPDTTAGLTVNSITTGQIKLNRTA